MYKISVPIMLSSCRRYSPEAMLAEVKRFDAQRVFLALGYYQLDPESRRQDMEDLKTYCKFFKEAGLEVGTWIWTFSFQEKIPFHHMTPLQGSPKENATMACPLDEDFLAFSHDYIRDIAATGVDIIMFDDDFRYGLLGESPACLCPLHVKKINQILGQALTREELAEAILSGGKNKYRDAWLQVNGDAFRAFAKNARRAVDSLNPAIRMGACACVTSWDMDGITAMELSTILAGRNQPFVRLIGAPYWAVNRSWGHDVQDVVELERMESAWTRFNDVEIFAEGDAYPRPRISCPSTYLESFDMAIRASGATDGILKYGVDYASQPGYENGYAIAHRRNKPLYSLIDTHFNGKKHAGIRIYEYPMKAADAVLPGLDGRNNRLDHLLFSLAARVLSHNAIPSVYEGAGVTGMAFGENARHLPAEAFEKGLILDIAAAKILQDRGVDVGLVALGSKVCPPEERFVNGNHVFMYGTSAYRITVSEKAEILSTGDGVPLSYRYENPDGQRFLVLNLVTDFGSRKAYFWKQYARGHQIVENTPWLSGEKVPASAVGNPGVYLQCKTDADSMIVGLWNLHPDPAFAPVVQLAETFGSIEFLNIAGTLEGDQVLLDEIPPYGFAAFTVRK